MTRAGVYGVAGLLSQSVASHIASQHWGLGQWPFSAYRENTLLSNALVVSVLGIYDSFEDCCS